MPGLSSAWLCSSFSSQLFFVPQDGSPVTPSISMSPPQNQFRWEGPMKLGTRGYLKFEPVSIPSCKSLYIYFFKKPLLVFESWWLPIFFAVRIWGSSPYHLRKLPVILDPLSTWNIFPLILWNEGPCGTGWGWSPHFLEAGPEVSLWGALVQTTPSGPWQWA